MKVGIIGAGSISTRHINAYKANANAEIVMIADLNEELAKSRAQEFDIPNYCTNYKELLRDDAIEAVSIVTPTFTHCQIVIDALEAGKHVLCEKPPALTEAEAAKCAEVSKKTGKVLMYGFVRRFALHTDYLLNFRDNGGFGKIYAADITRQLRCSSINGWFVDKKKSGGGMLMDAAIHELDMALYMMGYPKPVSVLGFTTYANKDLPKRVKGVPGDYASINNAGCERTVESAANGFITLENGSCITIRASHIEFCNKEGVSIELLGDKAGVKCEGYFNDFTIVSLDSDGYFTTEKSSLTKEENRFQKEVDHFVDCCVNNTPCIVNPEQAVILMRIMESIYKSAETGKPIVF